MEGAEAGATAELRSCSFSRCCCKCSTFPPIEAAAGFTTLLELQERPEPAAAVAAVTADPTADLKASPTAGPTADLKADLAAHPTAGLTARSKGWLDGPVVVRGDFKGGLLAVSPVDVDKPEPCLTVIEFY